MNATTKSHGMDGTLVEPDWPQLTLAELRALLAHYNEPAGPIEILSMSPRPFSAASVVKTGARRVFVKRHHASLRDREGLHEEHRLMAHLRDHGVPASRVMATASGVTAIEMRDWVYEVHDVSDGVDLYQDALSWTPFRSTIHARSAGQILARLHLASRGFNAPARRPRPLVASFTIFAAADPAAETNRYLAARPSLAGHAETRADCDRAIELLAPFHAELQPLLHALEPLWTHNDLHASNLLWSSAGDDAHPVAVIDFGLADRTNAVHDLAHAIERNVVEWLALVKQPSHPDDVPVHLDHLRALLHGYESVRPLSSLEAAALAPMTALCHAEFALTEADYFRSILHSDERARVATRDYLAGHAKWFRSAAGGGLLRAIREWAATRTSARRDSL